MVFKGCQRCHGDLWVEVDIVSRVEDLVCVQCGHHQTIEGPEVKAAIDAAESPLPSPRKSAAPVNTAAPSKRRQQPARRQRVLAGRR